MSDTYYMGYRVPMLPDVIDNSTVQAGAMGIMIGAAGAGAKNLHAYKDGRKTQEEAIGDTLRTALFAGTAAAMADMVADNTGMSGVVPTVAALTTGMAVMYLLTKGDKPSSSENTGVVVAQETMKQEGEEK